MCHLFLYVSENLWNEQFLYFVILLKTITNQILSYCMFIAWVQVCSPLFGVPYVCPYFIDWSIAAEGYMGIFLITTLWYPFCCFFWVCLCLYVYIWSLLLLKKNTMKSIWWCFFVLAVDVTNSNLLTWSSISELDYFAPREIRKGFTDWMLLLLTSLPSPHIILFHSFSFIGPFWSRNQWNGKENQP